MAAGLLSKTFSSFSTSNRATFVNKKKQSLKSTRTTSSLQTTESRRTKTKEQLETMAVIRKCMKYLEEAAKASYVRDAEIDLAREDYAIDQFRQLQDLLEEFVSFTPLL